MKPTRLTIALLPVLLAACAGQRGTAPDPAPGWSVELATFLPAIRACLGTSGGGEGVTKAWPVARRYVGVRVLEPGGGRHDCIASSDGKSILMVEHVLDRSILPEERAPLFTPSGREPPRTACTRTVPATASAGWLTYTTCTVAQATREPPPPKVNLPPSV